jgi:tetratricopeptide (TPR) repeat protein
VSLLLALLLQVGPNPTVDTLPRADDALINRPPPRRERRVRDPVLEARSVNPSSGWLQSCLDQIDADPARAHSMASIRRTEVEGVDQVLANLCLGTAAVQLGRWDEAREAFLSAREGTPAKEPATRARFAAMAGNAAFEGRDSAAALRLLAEARADARAGRARVIEAIALTDTARVEVAGGREQAGLSALQEATRIAPERAEGWLLYATLLRRLDRLEEAQSAIERAAALAPKDPEVGLEAGVIAVLDGRDEAARASWQSVIALDPGGPFAETARGYIAQLAESGPEGEERAQ